MAATAPAVSLAQPPVGVPCEIPPDRLDAAAILLRVIEQLPVLSAPQGLSPECALRRLAVIHDNHLHLAERARALLVHHPERAGPDAGSREPGTGLLAGRRRDP